MNSVSDAGYLWAQVRIPLYKDVIRHDGGTACSKSFQTILSSSESERSAGSSHVHGGWSDKLFGEALLAELPPCSWLAWGQHNPETVGASDPEARAGAAVR